MCVWCARSLTTDLARLPNVSGVNGASLGRDEPRAGAEESLKKPSGERKNDGRVSPRALQRARKDTTLRARIGYHRYAPADAGRIRVESDASPPSASLLIARATQILACISRAWHFGASGARHVARRSTLRSEGEREIQRGFSRLKSRLPYLGYYDTAVNSIRCASGTCVSWFLCVLSVADCCARRYPS